MRLLIILIFLFNVKALLGQESLDKEFEKSKGTWASPIEKINRINIQSSNSGFIIICSPVDLTIEFDSCVNVYFVQSGQVKLITTIGSKFVVIIKKGNYYLAYSGFDKINVKKGDKVLAGQLIGLLGKVDEGPFELTLALSKGAKSQKHIENWFRSDFQKLVSHPIN